MHRDILYFVVLLLSICAYSVLNIFTDNYLGVDYSDYSQLIHVINLFIFIVILFFAHRRIFK